MGLPDPGSARTWGGKLLVDRDGAEIGICTEIFLDDATGLPEWATADVGTGPAFIPLVDAVESGPRVRVAVRGVDVAGAPSVGDARHLTEDEEERLYRHYGIAYDRAASDSLLPADVAPSAAPAVSSTSSGPESTTMSAEGPAQVVASGQPGTDVTDAAETATPGPAQARRTILRALGLVAALAAITGAVLRSRRRAQPPSTRGERLAARARAASSGLDARRRQAMASAAPALQTGRRVSVAAAQRAATQAAMQAAAAAERASALAASAKATRLPRIPLAGDIVEPAPAAVPSGTERRTRVAAGLKTAISFGAGYLLGSRAGRTRVEQLKQATVTWAQRPGVQQTRDRLRAGVTDTLRAGNARLTQGTAGVAERLRRRPARDDASPTSAEDPGATAGGNGRRPDSPDDQ